MVMQLFVVLMMVVILDNDGKDNDSVGDCKDGVIIVMMMMHIKVLKPTVKATGNNDDKYKL